MVPHTPNSGASLVSRQRRLSLGSGGPWPHHTFSSRRWPQQANNGEETLATLIEASRTLKGRESLFHPGPLPMCSMTPSSSSRPPRRASCSCASTSSATSSRATGSTRYAFIERYVPAVVASVLSFPSLAPDVARAVLGNTALAEEFHCGAVWEFFWFAVGEGRFWVTNYFRVHDSNEGIGVMFAFSLLETALDPKSFWILTL